MSKRLDILKSSLIKKEQELQRRIDAHFETVKQANGQPLNDKRNGVATLNKWERQNDAIDRQLKEIEKTKAAIEREQGTLDWIVNFNESEIPKQIMELVNSGVLVQWRRYPHCFFVKGVDKARIIWDTKSKKVLYKYANNIQDKTQRTKFASVYNGLNKVLNIKEEKTEYK